MLIVEFVIVTESFRHRLHEVVICRLVDLINTVNQCHQIREDTKHWIIITSITLGDPSGELVTELFSVLNGEIG